MIHILPSVPPVMSGVGDYCRKLWENWPEPRPAWHCLALQVPPEAQSAWPEASIRSFEAGEAELLRALEEIEDDIVVLHYVGYGFHPKGLPTWLPSALKKWKARKNGTLIVMFHELYAQGNWRQRSFWTSPIARRIMVDLAKLSDRWVTSCPDYAHKVMQKTGLGIERGAIIPVGPSITPPPSADHPKRAYPLTEGGRLKLVLFGLANTRLWALMEHEELLRKMGREGLIESVLLLGKSDDGIEANIEAVRGRIGIGFGWENQYDLTPQEISRVLMDYDVGLISNSPGILTKSTVFASLCAHGIIPLISNSLGSGSFGVIEKDLSTAYLINDKGDTSAFIKELKNGEAIEQKRESVQQMYEKYLSWENITSQWNQVLIQT